MHDRDDLDCKHAATYDGLGPGFEDTRDVHGHARVDEVGEGVGRCRARASGSCRARGAACRARRRPRRGRSTARSRPSMRLRLDRGERGRLGHEGVGARVDLDATGDRAAERERDAHDGARFDQASDDADVARARASSLSKISCHDGARLSNSVRPTGWNKRSEIADGVARRLRRRERLAPQRLAAAISITGP